MFSTQNSVSFYSRLWEFIAKVVWKISIVAQKAVELVGWLLQVVVLYRQISLGIVYRLSNWNPQVQPVLKATEQNFLVVQFVTLL